MERHKTKQPITTTTTSKMNTQMITLKVELAKEKSLNKSLNEEMREIKIRHEEEIESMMLTIDMQTKIINELTNKCDAVTTMNNVLDNSTELVELESDMLDCSWEILDECEAVKNENVKMVVQLASEVDILSDKLSDASEELAKTKNNVDELKIQLKEEQVTADLVKEEMLSVQSDLARDILDLKVTHEMEMAKSNLQMKRQIKKNKTMKGKIMMVKRGADDFVCTTKMLCEYDIIC